MFIYPIFTYTYSDICHIFKIYLGKWPHWKGDKFCDDENNNCGCEWDGGDCCGDDVKTKYCKECLCLDPSMAATLAPGTAGR